MEWLWDPSLRYSVAAVLGMIAGFAAKQAVLLSAGKIPAPVTLLADLLMLGLVFIISMYVHSTIKALPIEAIALIAASLTMWGPKGIAALVSAMRMKATKSLGLDIQVYEPIEPVHRSTTGGDPMVIQSNDDMWSRSAPIRKLRDKIPLPEGVPSDFVEKLAQIDREDGENGKSEGKPNIGGNDE